MSDEAEQTAEALKAVQAAGNALELGSPFGSTQPPLLRSRSNEKSIDELERQEIQSRREANRRILASISPKDREAMREGLIKEFLGNNGLQLREKARAKMSPEERKLDDDLNNARADLIIVESIRAGAARVGGVNVKTPGQETSRVDGKMENALSAFTESTEFTRLSRLHAVVTSQQDQQQRLTKMKQMAPAELTRVTEDQAVEFAAQDVITNNQGRMILGIAEDTASSENMALRKVITETLMKSLGKQRVDEMAQRLGVSTGTLVADLADSVIDREKVKMAQKDLGRNTPTGRRF